MGKHHTARLLLTAAAGLLTACNSHAWPLITGIALLATLALMTLLASTDQRTPFERIVVLLCILRRIDPRPYLNRQDRKMQPPGTVPGQVPARPLPGGASRGPGAVKNWPIDDGV